MNNCNFWESWGRLFQVILSSIWRNYQSLLTSVNLSSGGLLLQWFLFNKDIIMLLRAWHEWVKFHPRYHKNTPSVKWIPVIWGGYQGDFSLRSTWPRGLCLIKFPHPWGKSSTLLHPFYNPPGWPGGLPPGQADGMCITSENWILICY